MNDKVFTTTVNTDGVTVRVIADTKAALTTAVNVKKLEKKSTRPDIRSKSDANKFYTDLN